MPKYVTYWQIDRFVCDIKHWQKWGSVIQLNWPSETDTLKIDLPQDREGYIRQIWIYGWKTLDKAHPPSSVFIFWHFWKKRQTNDLIRLGPRTFGWASSKALILSVWGQLMIFCLFSFLWLIWHVFKRYGWELSTVQRWASNSQYWWSYGTLKF